MTPRRRGAFIQAAPKLMARPSCEPEVTVGPNGSIKCTDVWFFCRLFSFVWFVIPGNISIPGDFI